MRRHQLNIHGNWKTLFNSYLSYFHVVYPADKAPNNHICVCKSHYIDCLEKESSLDNSLYSPCIYPDYPFGIFKNIPYMVISS